ncbi:MAG: sigma-70 family RNA polymerase sigma factor [bacterium]|jgi:RNA polymerase sigma-70 factor (ECF subfamily)
MPKQKTASSRTAAKTPTGHMNETMASDRGKARKKSHGAARKRAGRPVRKRSAKKITDEELVRLAKGGDTAAFGKLMERYQNKIYRLGRRMTETDEDAEDVLQEAFIKAFKSLGRFREKSKFSTWLYRITVNQALMKLRKKKLDAVSLDEPVATEEGSVQRDIEDDTLDPLDKLIETESLETLDMAIADLPPGYRAVFVLRHVEELSTEETARILKISVPAVKSRLHRTRAALKEKLIQHLRNQTIRG